MKKADIEKKKSLGRALYLSGMEQTEIADKIGVSRVTVSKWCSNKIQPDLATLSKIAGLLNVDIRELLNKSM